MPKPESDADKAKEKPPGGSQASEAVPGRVKLSEIGADLKVYIEAFEKLDPKEKEEFLKKAQQWDQSESVNEIRRAGITAAENEKDPNKKHELLSAIFLERDKKANTKMSFRVDFKGNDLAERKVGAGDLLPISAKAIRVQYADGRVIERALRTINPTTGRIGYYDADALKQGIYQYVPVFTGTNIDVLESQPGDSLEVKRRMFAENMEIYNPPQRSAPVSTGAPYAPQPYTGGPSPRSVLPGAPRRATVKSPGMTSMPGTVGKTEIGGQTYEAIDRNFWEKVGSRLITVDPVTGGPITFMDTKIPSINELVYPYLKEAEARLRERGIKYVPGVIQCFNPRNIADTNTPSYHTWAVAFDIDPANNAPYTQWEKLNPEKRVPMEFVEVMEELGFQWGGRWHGVNSKTGRLRDDPPHFEFSRINPLTSTSLLKSKEGQKYRMAMIDPLMPQKPDIQYASGKESPDGIQHHLTKDIGTIASDHKMNSEKMKVTPEVQKSLERFRERAMANRPRYEAVAAQTGIPWYLIAAIHERESGGRFDRYLHNGDPLGRPTTHVPVGKLFYDWESSAIDALNSIQLRNKLGINADTKDMGAMLAYAEAYNGLGYRKQSTGHPSPYVYAGTNIYQGGKYVRDGVYDPNAWDKQLGVATMLIALMGPEDYGPRKKNEAVA